MNLTNQTRCATRGLGKATRVAAFVLTLGLAALAQDREDRRNSERPDPPPPPPPPLMLGDETIGTLPILAPTQPFTLVESILDPRPSFYLQGQRLDVFSAVESCEGRHAVRLHVLDADTDTIRLVFHGRPRLKLHRSLIDSGVVQLGLVIPSAFGLATVDGTFGARDLPAIQARRTALAVPQAQILGLGAQLGRVLHIEAFNASGTRTDLRLRSGREFLFVTQSH